MKRLVKMGSCVSCGSVPSQYVYAVSKNAARLFDALYFWFFSFIFSALAHP